MGLGQSKRGQKGGRKIREVRRPNQGCGLAITVQDLAFTLSEMECHWQALSGGVRSSDFPVNRIPLDSVWKIDCNLARSDAYR